VPDLVLTDREQSCVRALMALEPTPGGLPPPHVLMLISRLVPSDTVDIHVADATGCVIDLVSLPPTALVSMDPQVCDGPLPLGIVHQSRDPDHQDMLTHVGVADGVVVGFRNGKDHVAQLSLDRNRSTFTERDLAMLRMISPALQRIMRTRPTIGLPSSLTGTERRILQLVATGRSNSDIAADLYVSVATVRKHLEHAYRKLGVHNRMAAVVAFGTGPHVREEHAEQDKKYA
jgi:DNA-binding CsgD family transcriptional regulator